jgi:hypothetical protein
MNLVYYTLYIVQFVINIGDRRYRHFGKINARTMTLD